MVSRERQHHCRCSVQRLPPFDTTTNINFQLYVFVTDAPEFHNCSTSAKDRMLALCMATADASKSATTGGTQTKQHRAWSRWRHFLTSIDLSKDSYLQSIRPHQQLKLLSAFGHTVRTGEYSKPNISRLGEESVRNAIDHVAQTFRNNFHPDPRLDADGRLALILQHQYKSYKNSDPPAQHQKALPGCILIQMFRETTTARSKAIADLCGGAFFFAMRSCEYLTVSGPPRKTKRLTLGNLRFYKNHKEVSKQSPNLHKSEFISITFVDQKNDMRYETVTMHAAAHPLLCPVKCWARVTKRALKTPKAGPDTPVNVFMSNNKRHMVSSTDAMKSIRAAAIRYGENKLGFKHTEIGTHSLRSGAAMAMYLDEVPVYTIMLIGRWSSDAFLLYIRRQVEQFSHNVSSRMIQNMDFTHVPNFDPHTENHDPRTRNHRNNTQTRYNMGRSSAHVIPTLPSFSIHT